MKEKIGLDAQNYQQLRFQEFSSMQTRLTNLETRNPVTIVTADGGQQYDFSPQIQAVHAEMQRKMDFFSKNYTPRLEAVKSFQMVKKVQEASKNELVELIKRVESGVKNRSNEQFAHRDRILHPIEQKFKIMSINEVEAAKVA